MTKTLVAQLQMIKEELKTAEESARTQKKGWKNDSL